MKDVILDEINVKAIEFVYDESDIVLKKAKPNFRTLGQKYGKQVQGVAAKIRELQSGEITSLQKNGSLPLTIGGTEFVITADDVEILHEDLHGWLVESEGMITIALDTEMTPALKREGLAREFVNRIQNLRKDAGFEVIDRITISYTGDTELRDALTASKEYVLHETLALDLRDEIVPGQQSVKDAINGLNCEIVVEKVQ